MNMTHLMKWGQNCEFRENVLFYLGQGDGPPWVSPVQLHQRSSHENPGWKVCSFLPHVTDVLVVRKICVIHEFFYQHLHFFCLVLDKEHYNYRGTIMKICSPTLFMLTFFYLEPRRDKVCVEIEKLMYKM